MPDAPVATTDADEVGTLADLVEDRRLEDAARWVSEHHHHEVADEIARMPQVAAAVAFRLLDKGTALEVFEELGPVEQQVILQGLRGPRFGELVESMDPDDRVRMLGEAPATVARRVLGGLSADERAVTSRMLGYPERSVGRYMTPDVVVLREGGSVADALAVVRRRGADAESVYTLPVVDDTRRLRGLVELRDLVLADPGAPLADVVDTDPPRVRADEPAEAAARLVQEANDVDLLVVDSEDRVLGLLSFDDVVEVIEEADSDDVARQAGARPWSGHYTRIGVWRLSRYRAMWLSLLLVAATLTVTVTQAFEDTLAQVAQLALFIPMLIGAGGNAGAQAATACVRALAVGEVRGSDLPRVVWRELRVGFVLGSLLAVLALAVGLVFVDARVALVVAISLVVICAWAATIGGTMPLLAKRLRIDPAVVSAPMVTTLVDATGLLIYFVTAGLVLGL